MPGNGSCFGWRHRRSAAAAATPIAAVGGAAAAPTSEHERVQSDLRLRMHENEQLRQQLQFNWNTMHQLMLEKEALQAKCQVLKEQNDALLSTQRAAYKCVDRASKETQRYRRRAQRLSKQKRVLEHHLQDTCCAAKSAADAHHSRHDGSGSSSSSASSASHGRVGENHA